MQYRRLGDSGLQVSLIGLGGNTFGRHFQFGKYNDEDATISIVDCAAALGINLIDTGDMYSAGDSERYIGKAIAGRRDKFIIASKVGLPFGHGPNDTGLSRGHIMSSIEGSLSRLGTDYVDIYYAHRPDPDTPLAETLWAFDDLVRQGKVRYVACSNYAGWQIAEAREIARHHGYPAFAVSQSPYNLMERATESEIVPACLHYGMNIIAYWPLAQGILAGKYRRAQPVPTNTRAWQNTSKILAGQMSERNLLIAERLAAWAEMRGHLVSELAIVWLAAKPFVCSILTGVTSIQQLESNVNALDWVLSQGEINEIERIGQSMGIGPSC
jgi:aryl-alcohol dehydrogenase-like predicted oxidoreductase